MNQFTYSNNQQQPRQLSRKDKMRSLEVLEEALFNEEYERCAELISSARALGALPLEIQKVLNTTTANIVKKEKIKGYNSTRF